MSDIYFTCHHTTAPVKVLKSKMVQVPCQCGASTMKRYPGRFCGPKRHPCNPKDGPASHKGDTSEGIWVLDGHASIYHEKGLKEKP